MLKKIDESIIAWVDVDELLVQFKPMFNRFLRETHSFQIDDDFVSSSWSYEDIIPVGKFPEYFNSLPDNWTQNLSAYPGAKEFLIDLKKSGCYIILITSVPEKLIDHRLDNLNQHGFYYDEIYFTTKPKSQYAKHVWQRFENYQNIRNILVDDRAKNCVDFLENLPNMDKAISLNVPYNSVEMAENKDSRLVFEDSTPAMWAAILKHLKNNPA